MTDSKGVRLRHRIRERGGLAVASALDGDRPCVVIRPSPGADEVEAVARLTRIAAAHARIASPHVPALVRLVTEGDEPCVVLDSDAVTDLEAILPRQIAEGSSVPYAIGIAFNELLMDGVEAAHLAHGGERPGLIGGLAWSNVLIGTAGRPQLIGFGESFTLRDAQGRWLAAPGAVEAPEIALGHVPTVAGDVFAVHALARNLLAHVTPFHELAAAPGASSDGAAMFRDALVALTQSALSAASEQRPATIAELRARYRAFRQLVPAMPAPDVEGLHAVVRALAGIGARSAAPGSRLLRLVVADRRAHPGDAAPIELGRRGPLWNILLALADHHLGGDPRTLDHDALRGAGWPGERMLPRAAKARIHVAVSNLRKLGLDGWIVSDRQGYRIDPDVTVHVDREGAT